MRTLPKTGIDHVLDATITYSFRVGVAAWIFRAVFRGNRI